jgi:hypothetical protein
MVDATADPTTSVVPVSDNVLRVPTRWSGAEPCSPEGAQRAEAATYCYGKCAAAAMCEPEAQSKPLGHPITMCTRNASLMAAASACRAASHHLDPFGLRSLGNIANVNMIPSNTVGHRARRSKI